MRMHCDNWYCRTRRTLTATRTRREGDDGERLTHREEEEERLWSPQQQQPSNQIRRPPPPHPTQSPLLPTTRKILTWTTSGTAVSLTSCMCGPNLIHLFVCSLSLPYLS